tara:strand:+ start:11845 stop:12684 length:840 start_codon:yes stop_codon:yes gene_type:complete
MVENKHINIIAEIGINHNGSIEIAKKLIDVATVAGCDYVKFQKREPEVCVPKEQRNKIRETPWGSLKYIDYKKRLEFGREEYDEIDQYCKEKQIRWFASVWDIPSVDFMSQYGNITKIPSALITNLDLLRYARQKFEFVIISTGMSTEEEIAKAVEIGNPDVIMHTNSSYPSKYEELNLNYIKHLKKRYPYKEIGYSGHEYGLTTTFVSAALGAEWIERHVTLDRTMWGSDQASSVDPVGTIKLVRGIRSVEKSLGPEQQEKRILYPSELIKRKSLRGE